ncbi:hypothetical protein GQ43DRAFT_468217 [Delitschia confertaspora ATCC 74209]|uniref:Uncharacterized protein n=1 Tax=Delitschia confertaspora ATCC 74209 TaxID=1513339 RepID=A0A9P4JY50_9PLEO|nr:hypothetical protein GQ43DRAFT_468217 [Delitschia confertaspora ATCC 74209]
MPTGSVLKSVTTTCSTPEPIEAAVVSCKEWREPGKGGAQQEEAWPAGEGSGRGGGAEAPYVATRGKKRLRGKPTKMPAMFAAVHAPLDSIGPAVFPDRGRDGRVRVCRMRCGHGGGLQGFGQSKDFAGRCPREDRGEYEDVDEGNFGVAGAFTPGQDLGGGVGGVGGLLTPLQSEQVEVMDMVTVAE